MDATTLQASLESITADYVRRLQLKVVSVADDAVTLTMPVTPELVHAGGVLCGQAMLAAADTAMLLAMVVELAEFRPMTTVQLQTSFLRPVPADAIDVTLTARVLRRGKNLCYGEIDVRKRDGKLAAHATTTYALL